jgi:hypothetical protein
VISRHLLSAVVEAPFGDREVHEGDKPTSHQDADRDLPDHNASALRNFAMPFRAPPPQTSSANASTDTGQFVVDIETTKDEAIGLAEEDNWRLGPGAYLMTRPAFWRDRQTALDVYKLACHRVVSRSKDALPGWVSSAVYGAASGEGPGRVAALAGILATYAILAAEFDPDTFAKLLGPVRSAVEDLAGPDPLPAIVGQLMAAFRDHFHPQLAARFMLGVASGLSESDRLTVLQLILTKGADESPQGDDGIAGKSA